MSTIIELINGTLFLIHNACGVNSYLYIYPLEIYLLAAIWRLY